MGPGYQALRENAAYLDLSSRGRIFASGEDRLAIEAVNPIEIRNVARLPEPVDPERHHEIVRHAAEP